MNRLAGAAGRPAWNARNREERNDATDDGRGLQEEPARRADGLLPREARRRRHDAPGDRPRRGARGHRLPHGPRRLGPPAGRRRRPQRPLLALLRDPPHAGGSAPAERAHRAVHGPRRHPGDTDQGDRHRRAVRPAPDRRAYGPQEEDELPEARRGVPRPLPRPRPGRRGGPDRRQGRPRQGADGAGASRLLRARRGAGRRRPDTARRQGAHLGLDQRPRDRRAADPQPVRGRGGVCRRVRGAGQRPRPDDARERLRPVRQRLRASDQRAAQDDGNADRLRRREGPLGTASS